MSSPNACYRRAPDIRIRPVPEMSQCLVFSPSEPNLYLLNTTSWLVLQLCDGRGQEEIARAFHHEVEPMLTVDESRAKVSGALDDLLARMLITVDA